MFEKLIESNSAGADFKPRRTFFMVSFVVVGIVFLSALVFDLYAANIDLGTDDFELVEILSPVSDVPEPKPPREQPQQRHDQQQNELPSRQELIARIDQTPQTTPPVSTERNTHMTIPEGDFKLNPVGPETNGSGPAGPSGVVGGSSSGTEETGPSEVVKLPDPPPVVVKTEPKKHLTQSKGVVNGFATDLPKPTFPAVARSMNLTGVVSVQVLINEQGDVVSAKAVDGHLLFRQEAERAAKRAKFKPTLLSDEPVKVTGVIVYRFTK